MNTQFHFTFENLEHQLALALDPGYQFIACEEYVLKKAAGSNRSAREGKDKVNELH